MYICYILQSENNILALIKLKENITILVLSYVRDVIFVRLRGSMEVYILYIYTLR